MKDLSLHPLRRSPVRLARILVLAALASSVPAVSGCTDPKSPTAARPEQADRWFRRAEQDFSEVRIEDAHDAITKALAIAPQDPEIRMLGGRIALIRLEFDESLRLLGDLGGSEAHALRGRAHWYRGELGAAAEELEKLLDDPDVRDEWAKAVVGLAREGAGRSPLTVSGEPRAVVELAHVSPLAPYLVVPVEIDGEERLALVATGVADVVVDSSAFAQPSWVSLRFKTRRIGPELDHTPGLSVSDVPALTQDLSGLAKEVNAEITALIGVNMLRSLHATIDYAGHQFIVRRDPATPPPSATKVNVYYARGGGMLMPSGLSGTDEGRATLYVDSAMRFPLALDDRGWVKAGVIPGDLEPIPGDPTQKLRGGTVPSIRLGAFRLDQVPGVYGAQVPDVEKGLHLDIDGIVGAPILAMYRITFADGGRVMYLEDDTELEAIMAAPPVPQPADAPLPLPQIPGVQSPGVLP